MTAPLLHLATTAEWRAHLAAGEVRPSVAEFVHLSTPDQVALPANRLFTGRDDLNLLVLDPSRIGVDVRYEPGLPTDPASMRFPHAYGPVPVTAVLAVAPYRAGTGGYAAPLLPGLDAAGRLAAFEPSFLRRVATRETPVTGGIAVRTDPVPASHRHNQLLIDGTTDAATVAADAARILDGRHVLTLFGEHRAATAAVLADAGWQVQSLVGMAGPAGGTRGRTEVVDVATLRPVWDAEWRRHLPGTPDAELAQLTDRLLLEERVLDLRCLALRDDDGVVVASAVLRIDGATAELDGVETVPGHRRRGHGDALLSDARAIAAEAGCDLVTLAAEADDHPRAWYARRGFAEVARLWNAVRPGG
ncbi:MAG: GNAT family N-acetyltransferase [Pseudonocardia sp.]|nr:GNAT family N-acetyltransferase [Pseudonocardia sp.]